jgi:hypothetical protein
MGCFASFVLFVVKKYQLEEVMIRGIPIEIGGKKYDMPPLGLDGLKVREEIMGRYAEMTDFERTEGMIEIVHAALVRNYPDLTLQDVRRDIHSYEITALSAALPALYEKSGLKSQGEPQRGAGRKKSTGSKSTAE